MPARPSAGTRASQRASTSSHGSVGVPVPSSGTSGGGAGADPTANQYVPRTMWLSADVTRQRTAYAPGASAGVSTSTRTLSATRALIGPMRRWLASSTTTAPGPMVTASVNRSARRDGEGSAVRTAPGPGSARSRYA